LVTSAVVAAELLYGAERSSRPDENRKEVHKALSGIKPLPFTLATAEHYARLKNVSALDPPPDGPALLTTDNVHPDRPNVPAERAALVAYLMRL